MPHLSAFLFLLLLRPNPGAPDLAEQGFHDMYNLSFGSAHQSFERWEKLNPGNPLGPVFDAAAYLFSEFDRLKILQSEFFVNDRGYLNRKRETPNLQVKKEFERALAESKKLSENPTTRTRCLRMSCGLACMPTTWLLSKSRIWRLYGKSSRRGTMPKLFCGFIQLVTTPISPVALKIIF
jgi:hypothetical protein